MTAAVIRAGTKLRFSEDGAVLTGLADGPADAAGVVTITTLEDPPRTFTRTESQVVVIGDESVFNL